MDAFKAYSGLINVLIYLFFAVALRPIGGHVLLILEVSR
jgi:hypothetical protein